MTSEGSTDYEEGTNLTLATIRGDGGFSPVAFGPPLPPVTIFSEPSQGVLYAQ
jgi:hypothetical protein